MQSKNKRILVTGGTGFVGKYLVKYLSGRGYRLTLIVRNPGKAKGFAKKSNIAVVKGNLLDKKSIIEAAEGACLIVHLAADKKNRGDINRKGMINLISAAKENKIKRIIHLSTINVKQKYRDIYAGSKLAAEKILQGSKMDFVILRPTLIYDMKANRDLKFFVKLVRHLPVVPSLPKNSTRMQPILVNDLVRIIFMLVRDNKYWKRKNRIFEIGGPDKVSMPEILHLFAEKLGLWRIILAIPLPLLKFFAVLLSIAGKRERILAILEDKTTISSVKNSFGFKAAGFYDSIKHMDL